MTEIDTTGTPQPTANDIGLRYGLIASFVAIFLFTVSALYLLKVHFFAWMVGSVLAGITPIVFYVLAAKRYRSVLGGYITVKEAFRPIFIAILVSTALYTIYNFLFLTVIDKDYIDRAVQAFDQTISGKLPEDQVEKQVNDFREKLDLTKHSFGATALGIATSIITSSIIGFIIALIIKKERPAAFQN